MALSRRAVVRSGVAAIRWRPRFLCGRQRPGAGGAQRRVPGRPTEPFGYCLNTSTIRGNNLDIVGVVTAAAKAGFHAIEPWISELDAYTAKGGTLSDLGKRIADAGLTVEDAIAFNSFLDDDETRRAASMEKLKIDMDKVAQIGGHRIAAPPGEPHAGHARQRREVLPRGARNGREDRRAAAARAVGHASGARARCHTASTSASRPDDPTPASCSTCSTCIRAARRSRR